MEKHTASAEYDANGWRVIALHHLTSAGECSCEKGPGCRSTGKHPVRPAWQEERPLSQADLITHFLEGSANIGLATGRQSGIWVLDVDGKVGEASLRELQDAYADLPETYTVRTGSGGRHYYFVLGDDDEVRNTQGKLGEGLDTRGDGGQVVAPPSITDKGAYAVLDGRDPVRAPEWLLALLKPREVEPFRDAQPPVKPDAWLAAFLDGTERDLQEVGRLTSGWDAGTWKVAVRLAEVAKSEWNDLSPAQARSHLHRHAPIQPQPLDAWPVPWTHEEVEEKWLSAWKHAKPVAPPAPKDQGYFIPYSSEEEEWPAREWTEFGNADRIVDHTRGRLVSVVDEPKHVAYYTGNRWKLVTREQAQHLVVGMMEALSDTEAKSYPDDDADEFPKTTRGKFLTWAGKQRAASKAKNALEVATWGKLDRVDREGFDPDPLHLGTPDGVVELSAGGGIIPHSPDLRIGNLTSVTPDFRMATPRWDAFLSRVMPTEEERAYLKLIAGYSLTGQTGEQVLFLHHGAGANGKSVFLDVMGNLVGGYFQTVPRTALVAKRNDSHPVEFARMAGKRFIASQETAQGRTLDEEVVKSITGGDRQVARHLYGEFFEFRVRAKLHYSTNHLPRVSDSDSIWRRIVVVRWGQVIPEGERDAGLARRLVEEEGPGILAWAIEGARAYDYERRVNEGRVLFTTDRAPLAWQIARDDYKEESDPLSEFVSEHLDEAPGDRVVFSEVYSAYQSWAVKNGFQPMNSSTLSQRLGERGMERGRAWEPDVGGGRKKVRVLKGWKVRPSALTWHG